jgi:hypothetical protein
VRQFQILTVQSSPADTSMGSSSWNATDRTTS